MGEEKDLKAQGPEAILKHAEKNKKKKTPEEAAKEARDRVMKPLVDLHNELSKMKGWQLRESRAAWDALVATGSPRSARRKLLIYRDGRGTSRRPFLKSRWTRPRVPCAWSARRTSLSRRRSARGGR